MEPLYFVPRLRVNVVMHNEILPLLVSAALKAAIRIRIVLVMIPEQVNTIWLGYRASEPTNRFPEHLGVVAEIIEVITEKDNFIGSYCGDNLFGPLPSEMDVRYNERNLSHPITIPDIDAGVKFGV
jgi:hypothetical protein